ncbi:lectin-like protein, partial [Nocardioides malaquae]|uniref:lectin-like protein n=1 Tax=Nocardioides malaquae TaxID=2773426 RepID=UPI0034DAD057
MSFKGKWVGLYDDVTDWRWSLADGRFYRDAEERRFRKWQGLNEPSSRDRLCVAMNKNGEWFHKSCLGAFQAICFDNTGEMCPSVHPSSRP